jgi:hypothetical protein
MASETPTPDAISTARRRSGARVASASAKRASDDQPRAAGGHPTEQVLAGLPGTDEHDEQLLLVADRVAGERRELQGRPAVGTGGLLVRDRELAVGHGRRVDEFPVDRAAAGGDMEASRQRAGAVGDRAQSHLRLVDRSDGHAERCGRWGSCDPRPSSNDHTEEFPAFLERTRHVSSLRSSWLWSSPPEG